MQATTKKLSKCPYFSSFYKHVFLNELNIFRISKAKAHRAADANLLNHVLKFSSAETTKGSSFNRCVERCRESDISSASALSLSFCFQTEVDFRGCERNKMLSLQAWLETAVRLDHFTHISNYSIFTSWAQQQCFLDSERNNDKFR